MINKDELKIVVPFKIKDVTSIFNTGQAYISQSLSEKFPVSAKSREVRNYALNNGGKFQVLMSDDELNRYNEMLKRCKSDKGN